MTKNWKTLGTGKYSFCVDGMETGTMDIILNSTGRKATAKIEGSEIIIRHTGFWKNNIEVTTPDNETIAKVYSEKWYAHSLLLDYNNKKYKLLIRNNPLAEWAITENGRVLLAYGLNTGNENGLVNIKITENDEKQPLLFDFILWYLFVPIAAENMGDDFTFLMLLAGT